MGKLRIGRLYIKPLYLALLIVGLLLVVGGAIALINSPAVWYEYVYGFKETDLEGVYGIGFSSRLAKGEVISGKLVVESGEAVLLITAKKESEERVVDSGRIQAGNSFSFSIKSDYTYTVYRGSFSFSGDTNAKLYCNLAHYISGEKSLYGKMSLSEAWKAHVEGIQTVQTVIFKPAKLK